MADSRTYLRIYFGGAVFLFLYNTLNGIYNAQGDSKTPLIFLMISSLTNIVLDLLFVIQLRHGRGWRGVGHADRPGPLRRGLPAGVAPPDAADALRAGKTRA